MYNKSSLLERTITINNPFDGGTYISIKDENGKSYSFNKNKKDGSVTRAYSVFRTLRQGEVVTIAYEEKPGSKGGTFRNIAVIKPTGVQQASNQEVPATPAPVPPKAKVQKDVLIGVLALVKSAIESGRVTVEELTNQEKVAEFVTAYENIVNGVSDNSTSDDLMVEGIPF